MTSDFLNAQEKDVNSKVRTGNLVYQDVEKERIKAEAELRAQEAKLASLGPQIARVDIDLRTLDRQEKGFQDLKRETAINEANYQVYVQKYEEARISDDMNSKRMSNISVIQAAAVPTEPIKPKKLLNIALVNRARRRIGPGRRILLRIPRPHVQHGPGRGAAARPARPHSRHGVTVMTAENTDGRWKTALRARKMEDTALLQMFIRFLA